MIQVTHFSDPGCPWAWSNGPAFAVLQWRYGAQLRWRHVMIGLSETAEQYRRRGYTGESQALNYRKFRHRGMPFATEPRERPHATWPMCRVVVATRRLAPDREWAVFRALQFAQFTSTLTLDEPEGIEQALAWLPGIDAARLVARLDRARDRGAVRRRPRARPLRRGRPDRVPGPLGDHARGRGPLHRPEPDPRGRGRPQPRGRRLPAGRGLRRRDRQPRPLARAAPAGRGRRRGAAGVPGRAHDRRGRRRDGAAPAAARPRGGRGRADRGGRRRARVIAARSATTRCGRRPLWLRPRSRPESVANVNGLH